MVQIKPIKKEQAAYEAIRQAIIDGSLQPGQKVSIRELAERFSFGRTPVADAMKRLTLEGWLESATGVATRVAALDLNDRYEYMQVRGALEVLAARLCALHAGPEDFLDFEHCLAVAQLAIDSQNWMRAVEADIEFHRICASKSGNHFLSQYYSQLLSQDERVFYRNIPDPEARIQSHTQHRAIYEAIRSGSPEAAASAASLHVDTILARLQADQQR